MPDDIIVGRHRCLNRRGKHGPPAEKAVSEELHGCDFGCTSVDTPYKFTGKERDSESNLDNFGARFYSSQIGRFMSIDPANAGADPASPQSWNMYSYVLNNPLNAIDPTGLDCVYLNDDGSQVSTMDPDSDANFCTQDGGFWVDGHANQASFHDYGNGEATIQNTNGVTYILCTGGGTCSAPDVNAGPPSKDRISGDWLGDGLIGLGAGGAVGAGRGLLEDLLGNAAREASTAGTATGATAGAGTGASSGSIAEVSSILQRAGGVVGNQGMQASSRAVAEQAAKDWVGAGARDLVDRNTGQFAGRISADGTRVARFTSVNKPQPYINLVNRVTGGNLHVSF